MDYCKTDKPMAAASSSYDSPDKNGRENNLNNNGNNLGNNLGNDRHESAGFRFLKDIEKKTKRLAEAHVEIEQRTRSLIEISSEIETKVRRLVEEYKSLRDVRKRDLPEFTVAFLFGAAVGMAVFPLAVILLM